MRLCGYNHRDHLPPIPAIGPEVTGRMAIPSPFPAQESAGTPVAIISPQINPNFFLWAD
jgi:hypothetical protein